MRGVYITTQVDKTSKSDHVISGCVQWVCPVLQPMLSTTQSSRSIMVVPGEEYQHQRPPIVSVYCDHTFNLLACYHRE